MLFKETYLQTAFEWAFIAFCHEETQEGDVWMACQTVS